MAGSGRDLRRLLESNDVLMVASAYDGLVSRVMQDAGFEALMLSGNSTSTSLGMVDVGLTTLTEVADHLSHITHAVDVPVLVDADTGYGGILNVERTVREMERAGAAGIMLEDQVFPKRSGLGGERLSGESQRRLLTGKAVVPIEEAIARVRTACEARLDPETVIVARTDARTIEGFDAALHRAAAYVDVGADMIYVEAPQSLDELQRLCSELQAPLMINDAIAGEYLSTDAARTAGCKMIVFSAAPTAAIFKAIQGLASHILAHGTVAGFESELAPRSEVDRVVGLERMLSRVADHQTERQGAGA
jgi:2-methylisocitrate lyase-like PEP mutase family enzyme